MKTPFGNTFIIFNIALIMMTSCKQTQEGLPVIINIDQNWTFFEHKSMQWLPATVPGTVHSDLLANGIIEDPHYRLNEKNVQWIENLDWAYRTTFTIDESLLTNDRVILDFKGLDTYAEISLNGETIYHTDNMFTGYQLDVKKHLKTGENTLVVIFTSPVKEGMFKLKLLDYTIPAINEQAPEGERSNVFTRKAPFHYGWDWGPRLVTSGIWRPVMIKAWNNAIIDNIYLETISADKSSAIIKGKAEISVAKSGNYNLSLNIEELQTVFNVTASLPEGLNEIPFEFTIDNPKLWWTNGLGEPHLYNFDFSLSRNNNVIDNYALNYGIRTLRLVQEPDEAGRTFYFELNGVPVFMKGANVIPSETLTPSISEQTYRNLIQNAKDAHMNMLRVWGGAIYEEDFFYELCDQNGILIWQDFMFACALQPGDEAHLNNIRREAEYNVKRLRNHACIALWCGNNENLHGWHHWGWKESYTPEIRDFMWRTYERIFHEILPDVVNQYDPKTAYWASSPSSFGNQLADRKSGDEHDWTIWFGQQPFSNYDKNIPRFVSEYGLQAFPGMHTIKEFSVEKDWDINSRVMRHRQRSKMEYIEPGFDGNDMIKRYMARYYKVPDKFDDFVYVSQLLQAKGYKTALEAHRRNMPHCMGSLYWQLNDSWPAISWASVDYYNRWKASHYAVEKANRPVIVAPVIEDKILRVYGVNDLLKPVNGNFSIVVMNFDGSEVHQQNYDVQLTANHSTIIFEEHIDKLLRGAQPNASFIHLLLKDGNRLIAENKLYFKEPKDLKLQPARISHSWVKTPDGYSITVSTNTLTRNLYLELPDPDTKWSDNFFDLMAGKQKTIDVITKQTFDLDNDLTIKTINNY